MDLSMWVCGECRCAAIAADLVACPQCSTPRAAPQPQPEPVAQESAPTADPKAPTKSKTAA